jgi:pyruvate/2-oxoacid:ferredoxin oxidoreductase beta subunit
VSNAPITTYLDTENIALPYCPGCGHKGIVMQLDKALVKLQLDPKKVVIVTDIGCIGLADRNFMTNTFHGLHGRSITYACGIKLARPELTVIAIKGDGACGIGGAHLLNVARRNIGITLIIANNFNYGMTGGQHSVTTPGDGLTSTTPWGNFEQAMDLCATASAAGAAWVHRATSFDKDLPDVLAEAITQEGFAMVDILELCSAYYLPRNDFGKSDMMAMLNENELKPGRITDQPRQEYTARYFETFRNHRKGAQKKSAIIKKFQHRLNRQMGIIFAGSAGQKIKSTATLLGQAAIASGLYATQKDDYPITVMTGHSLAEVILSPQHIDYTGIDEPDIILAISEAGVKQAGGSIGALPKTATIFAEESLDLPETNAQVRRFPFIKTAKSINRLSLTSVAIGSVLADTGAVPLEAFTDAIRSNQKPAIAEINIKAVLAGAALVKTDDAIQ